MELLLWILPCVVIIGATMMVVRMFYEVALRTVDNSGFPTQSVLASVVAKRAETQGTSGCVSTRYYVTFELKGGERLELAMAGSAYGLLVEGDHGQLTYQGTGFREFRRQGV